jgi:hypothetical protein
MNWCGKCSGLLLVEPSVEEQDPGLFSVTDPDPYRNFTDLEH